MKLEVVYVTELNVYYHSQYFYIEESTLVYLQQHRRHDHKKVDKHNSHNVLYICHQYHF